MTSKLDHFLSPYGTGLPCFVLLRRSTTPVENLSIPHGSLLLLRSSAHLYEQSNHKARPSSSNEPSNQKGPRLLWNRPSYTAPPSSLLKNVYFCTAVVSLDCAMEKNLKLKKIGTYRERSSPNYAYSTIKKASHNNGVQHNPPLK